MPKPKIKVPVPKKAAPNPRKKALKKMTGGSY